MNKKYYKILLLLLTIIVNVAAYAQTKVYIFKITVDENHIQELVPNSMVSRIDYDDNTTTPNGTASPLFQFHDEVVGKYLTLYYDQNMGQLSINTHRVVAGGSEGERLDNVYNLFYTKARLHNGSNILKLEVSTDLIWITCNPGNSSPDLIIGDNIGEGVLFFNKINQFGLSHLLLSSRNEGLISEHADVELLEHSFVPKKTRRSIENDNSNNDLLYYHYGYNEDGDVMQPFQMGNALNFDGVNDYVKIENAFHGLNETTFEFWTKPGDLPATNPQLLIGHNSSSFAGFNLVFDGDGKLSVFINDSNGSNTVVASNSSFKTNEWYHIAVVFSVSNNILALYVNGILEDRRGVGQWTIPSDQDPIYIGYSTIGTASSRLYNGTIDELRIWNTARTQADIQANMKNELTGAEPGLVNYYNFNVGVPCGSNQTVTWVPNIINFPILTLPNSNPAVIGTPPASGSGLPILIPADGIGDLYNFNLEGAHSNWVLGVTPGSKDSLCLGNTLQLGNYNSGGSWSSRNTAVASVDPNGVVTGLSGGTTIIDYTYTVGTSCPATSSTEIAVNVPGVVANNTGNALAFDGVNDYVNIPNSASLQFTGGYTLEAWIKPGGYSQRILDKNTAGFADGPFTFDTHDGLRLIVGLMPGEYILSTNEVLPINTWTHVAATCDVANGIVKLYVNGALITSGNFTGNLRNSSYPVRLGAPANGSGDGVMYNGLMDEVRIWNIVRTPTDILNNMNRELSGSETGLAGYYNFNEGVADGANSGETTLVDYSLNGNTGTLNGFALIDTTSNWVAGVVPNSSIELCTGSTYQLNNAVTGSLWSSTNPAVALVDSETGVVTAIAAGNTTINYSIGTNNSCPDISATILNVTGGATVSKNTGNALAFDGIDDFVNIPNSDSLQFTGGYTLEAWIKPGGFSTRIVDKNTAGAANGPFTFDTHDGLRLIAGFSNREQIVSTFDPLTLNEWTHVAASCDVVNREIKLYKNGVLVQSFNFPASGTLLNNSFPLRIGAPANGSGAGVMYNGLMDEVRIWNIVRNPTEILDNMNHELSGNEAGLVGYYNFTEGIAGGINSSDTIVVDQSLNGNDGTLVGFALSGTVSNWVTGIVPDSSIQLCAGSTYQLHNHVDGGSWSSANPAVASVDAATGIITALAAGSTAIIYRTGVTSPGYNSASNNSCPAVSLTQVSVAGSVVNQNSIQLCAGSTVQLDNTPGSSWSSSNPDFAIVDPFSGLVTGIKAGTTTIYESTNLNNACPDIYATNITIGGVIVNENNGNALSFNGTNSYGLKNNARGLDFNVTNALTAESWIKFTPGGYDFWLSMGGVNYRFGSNPYGQPYWDMGQHADRYLPSFTFSSNTWYHVAFTASKDAATGRIVTKLYINGILKATQDEGITSLPAVNQINLGTGESISVYNFNGTMDEVRIWDVARSQAQIQAAMNSELSGTEPGLVTYYNFNQGIAGGKNTGLTQLIDKSIYKNDCTLGNFALSGSSSNWVAGNVANDSVSLCPGNTIQLNNSLMGGFWSSSNPAVASVNVSTGVVTALSAGTAMISCTTISCPVISFTKVQVTQTTSGATNTGNALSFNGTNGYGIKNSASGLDFNVTNALTAESWIKFTPGGYDFWLSMGGVNYRFGSNPYGQPYWDMGQHADRSLPSFTFSSNTWYHVAFTASKDAITGRIVTRLYINGILKATQDEGITSLPAVNQINLGTGESISVYNFNGTMDEVRIWNVARSQAQIQAAMNSELSGTEPGLVTYYNFNQGIASGTNTWLTQVFDKSVNSNNCILGNFALSGSSSNWVAGIVANDNLMLNPGANFQLNNVTTGGVWSSDNTAAVTVNGSGLVTAVANGTATVSYILPNASGCPVTTNTSITVGASSFARPSNPVTSNIELPSNTAIRIFPNPAQDKVTVHLATGMENASLSIISVLGNIIAEDRHTGLQRSISLANITSGVYFVSIVQPDGKKSIHKLVIN